MALTRITKGVIKPNENYDTHNINSTGIVTAIGLDVNGNGDISGNLSVGGVLTYEDVTSIDSVGIITAQSDIHVGGGVSAVGVGTFGSLDISGDIDVDGHTNLDNVSIAGITTIAQDQELVFGSNADSQLTGRIKQLSGSSPSMQITSRYPRINALDFRIHNISNNQHYAYFWSTEVALFHQGNKKFSTTGGGIDVTGNTVADGLVIDGNSDLNGDLDVDGHTNLDNGNVAGIVTFNSGAALHMDGGQLLLKDRPDGNSNNLFFGTGGKAVIYHDGTNFSQVNNTGHFYLGQGVGNKDLYLYAQASGNVLLQQNTGVRYVKGVGSDASVQLFFNNNLKLNTTNTGINITGTAVATGADINGDLDVDGHTNLDNVSIAGVSTFTGTISANNHIELASGKKLSMAGDVFKIYHSTNAAIINESGDLIINQNVSNKDIIISTGSGPTESLRIDSSGRLKVGDNVRPASDANEGAGLRVTNSLTRNQYYSPHGHYFGSIGYTDNSNTKAWLAVDSSYAQSSAVSAGIFLSAFHQDAGGSACGYTIKNLKSDNSLVFSSVKTAASVSNPAVEEERVRINHAGEVGINVTAASGNLLHIKKSTADSFAKIESESGYDAALLLDTSNGSGASADVRFQMDGSTKGSIQYVNNASSADANSMIFRTGNNSAKMQITTGGNIGIPDRTGTDFSLLDGMVINTANGSAGLLINSSSSSHNAYLGFSYGSGSSTSHADQYSAYIGRVGDDTLILGAGNDIKVQIGTDGEVKCVGADDNKGFAVYTTATKKVAELIEHSADGELRLYTGESTPVLRSVITSYGDSYLCANSTNKLGIGVGGVHGTIAQKVHIFDASNDPYIRIQRGTTSDVNMGGIEFASSNGNGNNMIGTIYGRATGNSATTGVVIVKARDSSSGSNLNEPLRAIGKSSSGCRLISQGNAVCVFGRHHEPGSTDCTADAPTYNTVYEHSSSSYRTSGNGAFGGSFVVGGNANYWYPVWFSQPTHQEPQILYVSKYVHNYATWDGTLAFRASLHGTGYGAFTVQHRVHFYSSSNKEFIGKIAYTGHNNAYLVLWMRGGGRSYQWGTIGAQSITVNVGDDGNSHNLGPGNTAETYITNNVSIPQGYEQAMTNSGTFQQSDGF